MSNDDLNFRVGADWSQATQGAQSFLGLINQVNAALSDLQTKAASISMGGGGSGGGGGGGSAASAMTRTNVRPSSFSALSMPVERYNVAQTNGYVGSFGSFQHMQNLSSIQSQNIRDADRVAGQGYDPYGSAGSYSSFQSSRYQPRDASGRFVSYGAWRAQQGQEPSFTSDSSVFSNAYDPFAGTAVGDTTSLANSVNASGRAQAQAQREADRAEGEQERVEAKAEKYTEKQQKAQDRAEAAQERAERKAQEASDRGLLGVYRRMDRGGGFGGGGGGGGGYGFTSDDFEPGSPQAQAYSALAMRQNIQSVLNSPLGRYGVRAARGLAIGLGEYAIENYRMETQATLTGRHDPLQQAGAQGGLYGGIAGALVGALPIFGPFGPMLGGAMGNQIGSMAAEYFAGEKVLDTRLSVAALGTGTLSTSLNNREVGFVPGYTETTAGGKGYVGHTYHEGGLINPGARTSRFIADQSKKLQNRVRLLYGDYFNQDQTMLEQYTSTAEEIGQQFGSVYSSLIQGGVNPETMVDSTDYAVKTQAHIYNLLSKSPTMSMSREFATHPQRQDLYFALTQRANIRYLKSSSDILSKEVNPILGTLPETGGNLADILMKFGPTATQHYNELQQDVGEPVSTNLPQLMYASASYRTGERQMAFNSTFARGVAGRQEDTLGAQMETISRLPGGKDSLTYNQLNASRRQATIGRFGEEDITGFDLPMSRLEGQRQRANLMPFSPIDIYGLDLKTMMMNNQQIGRLSSQEEQLRRTGDLSEQKELEYSQRIEGLKTRNVGMVNELSEDFPRRLPEFSAGRPSFFQSYNSWEIGALAMKAANVPVRFYGALTGAQRSMQDAAYAPYNGLPTDPRSHHTGWLPGESFQTNDYPFPNPNPKQRVRANVGDTGAAVANFYANHPEYSHANGHTSTQPNAVAPSVPTGTNTADRFSNAVEKFAGAIDKIVGIFGGKRDPVAYNRNDRSSEVRGNVNSALKLNQTGQDKYMNMG